jgi:hypothetical protein
VDWGWGERDPRGDGWRPPGPRAVLIAEQDGRKVAEPGGIFIRGARAKESCRGIWPGPPRNGVVGGGGGDG